MADFNIRSDSINVEQIMEQIRSRIREKRGVDYTEQQIRELAAVKLERLLDPRGVRSDLLERFRRVKAEQEPPPNFAFEEDTLYETHRPLIRWIRRLLQPVLKLLFNPNPLIQALNIQSRLNTLNAQRSGLDELYFEVIHNLVLETTRLGIEVKNLKMRAESLASRLDFNERRARALESAVVYRPSSETSGETPVSPPRPAPVSAGFQASTAAPDASLSRTLPSSASTAAGAGATTEGPGQRSRRRRRRRGRRGGGPPPMFGGGSAEPQATRPQADESARSETEHSTVADTPTVAARPQKASDTPPAEASSSGPGPGGPEPDAQ